GLRKSVVGVLGDRGDLSRTVCLSGPTQKRQRDTRQYPYFEAAILTRQAIAGNNQPNITPQLSRSGGVLLWEEQLFLVREPVELSISHILASRCTITGAEMDAATMKLIAFAEVVERLIMKNPSQYPWTAELNGLPKELKECDSPEKLLRVVQNLEAIRSHI
ncbi:hypothetical protein N7534_003680, partial [Penicillium rubens]